MITIFQALKQWIRKDNKAEIQRLTETLAAVNLNLIAQRNKNKEIQEVADSYQRENAALRTEIRYIKEELDECANKRIAKVTREKNKNK